MSRSIAPWHGRTILVTGGAGYLGSQLIRELGSDTRYSGVRIRILDNFQRGTYAGVMGLPSSAYFELVDADLLDSAALREALRGVHTVFHLAALVRTPFSFDHPTWTEHVNHWGTARLAELCLEAGIKDLVYTSTTSIYGRGTDCTESSAVSPLGPYATSKLHAETALRAASERGLRVTVLRLGTIYGVAPVIRMDAFANKLAYLAARKTPLTVHGTGTQLRPLVHVSDASAALRLIPLSQHAPFELYNVAAYNVSVHDVISALQACCDVSDTRYTDQHSLAEISLSVDCGRFTSLGWQPSVSLQQGLAETVRAFGPFTVATNGTLGSLTLTQ